MTYQDIYGHKERQSARTSCSIVLNRITQTAHRKVINKELHEICLVEARRQELAQAESTGIQLGAFTNK
jgi:hypothetical protein